MWVSDPYIYYITCPTCGVCYQQGAIHICNATVTWPTHPATEPVYDMNWFPTPIQAKITVLPGGTLPVFGTNASVGFDLAASEDTAIPARGHKYVKTGLIIEPPAGYWLMIAARGSLIKRGLFVANGIGVVDPDYCGPEDDVRISIYNLTDGPVFVQQGERLAQGMFVPTPPKFVWKEVAHGELLQKNRGGFGSTGL